jgi:hypothetical protein
LTAGRALLALAGAVLIAGCGSDQQPQTITVVTTPETAGVAGEVSPSTPPTEVDAAPSAAPPAPAPEPEPEPAFNLDTPPGVYPAIWVRAGHEVAVRTEPGGGELVARVGRKTEFGSPTVFGVADREGDWAGVTIPQLPNNQLGWVRLDPRRAEAGWTSYAIAVDLSERTATLLKRGDELFSFPVTVGAPSSVTPTGRFSVTDTFTGLDSAAYGCCALALSANQPNLPSGWLGGRRIAIHGTSGPLGVASSYGCVRAADATVARLVDTVPLGTPVFIRA